MPLAFPNPALTTAGIVLRHLEAGDIPWMAMACNDRELSRYVPVFGKLGIERLHLVTAPENVASQRVAERAGS